MASEYIQKFLEEQRIKSEERMAQYRAELDQQLFDEHKEKFDAHTADTAKYRKRRNWLAAGFLTASIGFPVLRAADVVDSTREVAAIEIVARGAIAYGAIGSHMRHKNAEEAADWEQSYIRKYAELANTQPPVWAVGPSAEPLLVFQHKGYIPDQL